MKECKVTRHQFKLSNGPSILVRKKTHGKTQKTQRQQRSRSQLASPGSSSDLGRSSMTSGCWDMSDPNTSHNNLEGRPSSFDEADHLHLEQRAPPYHLNCRQKLSLHQKLRHLTSPSQLYVLRVLPDFLKYSAARRNLSTSVTILVEPVGIYSAIQD